MAASCEFQCEPCKHVNVPESASNWCEECEESLCDACCRSHKAQKISRDHNVIAIEEYQKTQTVKVNLICPDHGEKWNFYCPKHQSVGCESCVQSKHNGCKDIMPINEAAKDAKISTAFTDLEQTIDGLLENIEKGVRHLQQNITNLKEKRKVTKKSFVTMKAEINKHLDHLEKKILKQLKSKSKKAVKEISKKMTKLEPQRKKITDLKNTAKHMKQFSSDLQMFVGIRSMHDTVMQEIDGIKLLVNSIQQLSIDVHFNPTFETFTQNIDSLVKIQITSEEAVVPYVEKRLVQAQYQRPAEPLVHKLDNVHLKLRTNITMGENNSTVTSCLILPNKSVIIVGRNKACLTILEKDGSHDRNISVPYDPYDVTIIDDQRVAVSYGYKEPSITCITIVNINNQLTNQTRNNLCKEGIYGITYNDGKLYAVARGEGIKVIDLNGNIIKTIRIHDDELSAYKVTIHKDKIYYSVDNGSVDCVDMKGKKIWTCQDDRLLALDGYLAIAVDKYSITFAAGYDTNLLLAISPDGKQQKVLLTISDSLLRPSALFYDKDGKQLLICNASNGHAALYDVIYL